MKKLLFFVLLSFVSNNLYANEYSSAVCNEAYGINYTISDKVEFNENDRIDGSSYLFDYSNSYIITKENKFKIVNRGNNSIKAVSFTDDYIYTYTFLFDKNKLIYSRQLIFSDKITTASLFIMDCSFQ